MDKQTKGLISLGFFTSLSGGVLRWKKMGTLGRELQLYRKLGALGLDVHVFSVDRQKDLLWTADDADCLGLKVHGLYPNWLPFNRALLVCLMPLLLLSKYFVGRQMDVLKTNQGHSGMHVMLAAVLWRKPYISRSGYVLSEQLGNRSDISHKDRLLAVLERVVMRRAICCFVPTPYHVEWCREHVQCRQLELMPNNVDASVFRPEAAARRENYVLAVGRVVAMKRYDILSQACAKAGISLKIAGDGPDCDRVTKIAESSGCQLEMLGRVPNAELPSLMAGAAIYVICSEYEGHPKSLVEAMACGCACIGTDSPGIRNQIRDGENGILAVGTESGLAAAIRRIIDDDDLTKRIRTGARQYALENFSLEALADKEAKILARLCAKRKGLKDRYAQS